MLDARLPDGSIESPFISAPPLVAAHKCQTLESRIMGMFDEVRCEYPLPDAQLQHERFQTKDFYQLLENYTITKDGKLIHDSARWGKVEVPYTGDFRFYTSRGEHQDNTFEWFEYSAEFKDGQLQSISRVHSADNPNGSLKRKQ